MSNFFYVTQQCHFRLWYIAYIQQNRFINVAICISHHKSANNFTCWIYDSGTKHRTAKWTVAIITTSHCIKPGQMTNRCLAVIRVAMRGNWSHVNAIYRTAINSITLDKGSWFPMFYFLWDSEQEKRVSIIPRCIECSAIIEGYSIRVLKQRQGVAIVCHFQVTVIDQVVWNISMGRLSGLFNKELYPST